MGARPITCPLTEIEGGRNLLYEADDDAVIMTGMYSAALTHTHTQHTTV